MSARKLSKAEFENALKKGLGRAFIHVRDHGDAGVEDSLLHACLHNIAYDRQCEDYRGPWLLDMIEHTKTSAHYHDRIATAFMPANDRYDVDQLGVMLAALARLGRPGASDLLYQKFDLQEFGDSDVVGREIVELDGISGLLHVAEVIGGRIRSDPKYWESSYLPSVVSEQCGVNETESALREAAGHSDNIKAYVENVIATSGYLCFNPDAPRTPAKPKEQPSLQEFLSPFDSAAGELPKRYPCLGFGRRATQEDIETVYSRLAAETDRDRLLRYLWVFQKREIPRLDDFMLRLAESPDDDLRDAALRALAHVGDPAVRRLAVKLLEDRRLEGIQLFANNYAAGDFDLIFKGLDANAGDHRIHRYGSHILDVLEKHKDADAADCLLWLYENNPCSMCRSHAVEQLIEIGKFPQALAEECQFDADGRTREAVSRLLNN